MIVILPTNTGFLVGTDHLGRRSAKPRRASAARNRTTARRRLAAHLSEIRRWMRLSKRYAN